MGEVDVAEMDVAEVDVLEVDVAEVDGNRTRPAGVACRARFEGGGAHQVPGHLRSDLTLSSERRRGPVSRSPVSATAEGPHAGM
jgi:hypothetical protein